MHVSDLSILNIRVFAETSLGFGHPETRASDAPRLRNVNLLLSGRRRGGDPRPSRRQRLRPRAAARALARGRDVVNLRLTMSKLLRGAVAGAGAWKLGGGVFGTILMFVLLWVILGYFDIFK
jgi:hypothetical protein